MTNWSFGHGDYKVFIASKKIPLVWGETGSIIFPNLAYFWIYQSLPIMSVMSVPTMINVTNPTLKLISLVSSSK